MPSLLRRILQKLRHRFWLAPRGGGKPVPLQALDAEYHSGNWDHFFGPDELARHEQMVALILAQGPRVSLLDLGCGSGRLLSMLPPERLDAYLGVDLSTEGLKRAGSLGLPHARFQQADFTLWRPSGRYDVITFNECIGYAECPARVAADFARHLNPGGVVIVSHFRWGNHEAVWRSLEKYFTVVTARTASNDKGQLWDLRVLSPRPGA